MDVDDDWEEELQRIRENDPHTTDFGDGTYYEEIRSMTDDGLEQLGKDIANNTHLTYVDLSQGTLNDHQMLCLFRGLTRSNSINHMILYENQLSVAGTSMLPFLQNAKSLTYLDLDDNNIQSEGFNSLFRALSDSPIERLDCCRCGIESIDIDIEHTPRQLKDLHLDGNIIKADGCRELATLLQGRDATLKSLYLYHNKIGDDGVENLVNALQKNTSLNTLGLRGNTGISQRGKISLLKLVIDISSIEATLQSNHTLRFVKVAEESPYETELGHNNGKDIVQQLIDEAVSINSSEWISTELAGRVKVRQMQIRDTNRAQLAVIQGVTHSVYSEIDSLYLPEVLALLTNSYFGRRELFSALKSTMTGLLSRIDMKLCIQEQMARNKARIEQQVADYETGVTFHRNKMAYHETRIKAMTSEHESVTHEHEVKMEELKARLAAMEDTYQKVDQETRTQSSSKRRRVD